MNNIEASRGHLLTEYAMCEQGTFRKCSRLPERRGRDSFYQATAINSIVMKTRGV